jgi:hypothetical protein
VENLKTWIVTSNNSVALVKEFVIAPSLGWIVEKRKRVEKETERERERERGREREKTTTVLEFSCRTFVYRVLG